MWHPSDPGLKPRLAASRVSKTQRPLLCGTQVLFLSLVVNNNEMVPVREQGCVLIPEALTEWPVGYFRVLLALSCPGVPGVPPPSLCSAPCVLAALPLPHNLALRQLPCLVSSTAFGLFI